MAKAYVKSNTEGGIATITFFTPTHNSMPTAILQALEKSIHSASADSAVRVIVLQSAGDRTFCAGASFEELKAISDEESGKHFFNGFAGVINAMRTCKKLIIGRVQGKAVGGGVGLAAATDYCFATQYAAIKLSEFTIGIGPFVIAPAVKRKMGVAALSELTINATAFYPATWAHTKGLYAEVFDTAEDMDLAVTALATKLASYNPEALKAMKRVFWEDATHWKNVLSERAATSGTLVLSTFTKERLKDI